VKLGLVASLNRPGGNVTGVNQFVSQMEGKRLGLLRELMPSAALKVELETAFATARQVGCGGLLVAADAFFNSRRTYIVALAARHAIPATDGEHKGNRLSRGLDRECRGCAAGCDVQDMNLLAEDARRLLDILQLGCRIRIVRIEK
jgi:hypothetical protein